MPKLFVYGTLKRGNPRSMENCYPGVKYRGEEIIYGYTLYKMPFRDVPVMVATPKYPRNCVRGEVYIVSKKTLEKIDMREGVHIGWYTRILVPNNNKELIYSYIWKRSKFLFKHIGSRFIPRVRR